MRPSDVLALYREEIRCIVARNKGQNPRVFGSVLRGNDHEGSDLDLLIDAGDGMTLFDIAGIMRDIKRLVPIGVDVKTPEDLSVKFRSQVVNEARPL
jgi:uncharacterized protein